MRSLPPAITMMRREECRRMGAVEISSRAHRVDLSPWQLIAQLLGG